MSNSKPLNPAAHEWRPFPPPPPPLPHLVFRPIHYFFTPPPLNIPYNQPQPTHFNYRRNHPNPPPPPPHALPIPPPMRRQTIAPPTKKKEKKVWAMKSPPKIPDDRRGAASTSKPVQASSNKSLTTVMIKNIPNKFWRNSMLDFVDGYCRDHTLEYDFFYLPMDFSTNNNLGYAFVNLTTAKAANDLERILNNFKWKEVEPTSNKICKIAWAEIQGKEALVEKFRKSIFKCDWEEFLPVILEPPHNGVNSNEARPLTVGIFKHKNHRRR